MKILFKVPYHSFQSTTPPSSNVEHPLKKYHTNCKIMLFFLTQIDLLPVGSKLRRVEEWTRKQAKLAGLVCSVEEGGVVL